ncbi:hypothetical protein skT53_33990 [Effusibacillus dendaii]|uniref:Peptide deformylase n=1 Tax=Effusibacillus dendaii TaxID=2743772 RepID=A0A7I8DE75_9BACL|nr:hypothetical protein skT53_33990 [Effusibacillus dendaii]
MAICPIVKGDVPILRQPCKPISDFDQSVRQLLDDLTDTMCHHAGVGLAAPQIGISLQAAVVDIGTGPLELLNPVIRKEEGTQSSVESCLSFPGTTLKLERPEKIWVSAKNSSGEDIRLEAFGFLARVICHEIDHLNGVLFFDRMTEEQFFSQLFDQIGTGNFSSSTESGNTQRSTRSEMEDIRLAADFFADSIWKLELGLDLLRNHAANRRQAWERLHKISKQLAQAVQKWEND